MLLLIIIVSPPIELPSNAPHHHLRYNAIPTSLFLFLNTVCYYPFSDAGNIHVTLRARKAALAHLESIIVYPEDPSNYPDEVDSEPEDVGTPIHTGDDQNRNHLGVNGKS